MSSVRYQIAGLSILFEDDHLLAVEKPTGLLTVPGKTEPDCLVSRLKVEVPEVRAIHRLDRDTSGIVLLARNAEAQRVVGRLFENRSIRKAYQAIVIGHVRYNQTIDLPIRRDMTISLPPTYIVDPKQGRIAITGMELVSRGDANSRVRLEPKTGRSHQLRVHCQAIGHPIVGDPIYGTKRDDRLMLHACALSFPHPVTNDMVRIESRVPF